MRRRSIAMTSTIYAKDDDSSMRVGLSTSASESTLSATATSSTSCLPPALQSSTASAKRSLTCTFAEIPSWMQDNSDIHRGYRPPTFSYAKCAKSLFYLHNESVNIWSHLVGALLFLGIGFFTYFKVLSITHTVLWSDIAVFYSFLVGAVVCLGLSSSFHTFACHSEPVCSQWNRCDYVGIVFLIVGSFYPAVFYGFYCHNILKAVYIAMITVFGAATVAAAVTHRFRTPQFRWVRTSMFLAMGLSAIIPVIHALFMYGFQLSLRAVSLHWMILMGALYVIGALIYAARIPERWFPGKFDIWFSSHQIFHLFVVAAAIVHYIGVTSAMHWWHSEGRDACDTL